MGRAGLAGPRVGPRRRRPSLPRDHRRQSRSMVEPQAEHNALAGGPRLNGGVTTCTSFKLAIEATSGFIPPVSSTSTHRTGMSERRSLLRHTLSMSRSLVKAAMSRKLGHTTRITGLRSSNWSGLAEPGLTVGEGTPNPIWSVDDIGRATFPLPPFRDNANRRQGHHRHHKDNDALRERFRPVADLDHMMSWWDPCLQHDSRVGGERQWLAVYGRVPARHV